jgi:hypothetical protein
MPRPLVALLLLGLVVPLHAGPTSPTKTAPRKGPAAKTVLFTRVTEPNERAFNLLVPKGWRTEGGITRVNPMLANGSGNAIGAKIDYSVKRDTEGSVMLRWLPSIQYVDTRGTMLAQMFPPGSMYNGMPVLPLGSAADFLVRVVLPYVRPGATGVQVVEQKPLPEAVRAYQAAAQANGLAAIGATYDAALLTVTYTEGGVRYREVLYTGLENLGPAAAGMWSNKDTLVARAPDAEFDAWKGVGETIRGSVKLDPAWVQGELRGQAQRGQTAALTQRHLQDADREITANRQRTNAEIRNDQYLTLTGQEDYVNPYSNEVERGTNEWQHRWVDAGGSVLYTNDAGYDPNVDPELNGSGFKRSQVRKR